MLPKRKPNFNTKQREIMRTLNKSRVGLTPYEVSKRTGIAWVTCKKHIKQLQTKKVVTCKKSPYSSKNLCRLNYGKIYGKKQKRK